MKDMADRMAADGFKDAGYEYVIVDDCWPAHNRTAQGQLQPDPDRFPSGIKALADYVCKSCSILVNPLPQCGLIWLSVDLFLEDICVDKIEDKVGMCQMIRNWKDF